MSSSNLLGMAQFMNKSGSMIIDGIFASEAIDSSGEILDVEGCDISSLEAGDGTLNWEHKGDDNDETRNPNDHVGHIVYAKKIFSEKDCENDRQRKYWNQVKLPMIYGVVRLYDGSGEPGAVALAAQIRDHKINGEPILVRFSIEGSTLEKDGNKLVRSVARRVAATIKPCNKSCLTDVIADPNSPFKTEAENSKEKDLLAEVVARKSENPMYGRIGSCELECDPEVTEEELTKSYTAGCAVGAPSTLTGGAALQREDVRRKIAEIVKNFDEVSKDKSKTAFRAFVKHHLPEASDEFLDHFADLVDDYRVKLRKDEAAPASQSAPESAPAAAPKVKKPKLAVVTEKSAKGKKRPVEIPSSIPRPESPRPAGGVFPVAPYKQGKPTKTDLATFDPEQGVLSVGDKKYQADVSKEGWNEVLKDPKFVEMFDSIANNVKLVTELRKQGVHLPGEFEIAAAMGGYSANEQVPVQEAAIGHTIDEFGDKLPELSRRPPTDEEAKSLNQRFQSATLPKFGSGDSPENPDQWTKLYPTLALKNPDQGPENPGPYKRDDKGNIQFRKIGKPRDKIGTLTFFHRLAPILEDLVKKHGTDGQAIANELIKKKDDYEKWKNGQRQAYDKGLKDWKKKRTKELEGMGYKGPKLNSILAEEQAKVRETYGNWGNVDEKLAHDGPIIEFLSNKTLRYMVGMLGATNVTVPDTHFTRHFFNQRLRTDDQGSKDLDEIKATLLNPLNAHVLNSIDEFHRKNHPAAKWVRDRYFGGKDDPASTFLGFWAHWMNIPKHEQLTGRAPKTKEGTDRESDASNDDSTHASYFLHISHQMKKYGIPGWDKFVYKAEEQLDPEIARMPLKERIQLALSELADQHGPEAASLAYFAMVPALYGEYQQQQAAAKTRGVEGLGVDLQNVLSQFKAGGQDQGFRPDVRSLAVNIDGQPRHVGRFLIHNGQLRHLEDYHGLLGKLLPEGPVTDATIKRLHAMAGHPDMEIGTDRMAQPEQRVKEPMPDPMAGAQAAAVPVPAAPAPRPAPVFEYTRAGHDEPHILEVQNGTYLLDGNPLSYPEVALLVENVKNGAATLRYRVTPFEQTIAKMEALMKAVAYAPQPEEQTISPHQMDIEQALQHVRNAVAAGKLHPSVADALTAHVYEDPMLAGSNIGNKFAFTQFRNQQKPGVYLSMDGNDFKSVNDKYGHDTGDSAIKAMGSTLRSAMTDSVGDENGKLFRNGGDEFTAYFPSHEHAVRFARAVRDKFDALPPIRDNHKLSMGIGIGHNPVMADNALYEAKKQKLQPGTLMRAFEPGQVPTLAHSLMPGNEGAVPLTNPDHTAVKAAVSPMPTPPTGGEQPSVPVPSPISSKA